MLPHVSHSRSDTALGKHLSSCQRIVDHGAVRHQRHILATPSDHTLANLQARGTFRGEAFSWATLVKQGACAKRPGMQCISPNTRALGTYKQRP
jgi:hypothetical protein